ncbi:MAG TPA: dTDP-4-dehydrorhamnose reductase [Solirubrobacteraceae bacterium]|nr:dTDP-4-dehydrorhamnose reductase [Solirubrobacteraceae bacterium]
MHLLVTGAKGMLGHRVAAVAHARGHAVTASDLPELDLTDERAVRELVDRRAPDAIVNCAAYTDVDGCEADEELATRVNGDAAGNVARCGVPVVHVSTDYVFAGEGRRDPYVESDPPAPRTAYGRSKLAGERAVREADDRHAIVRTAWLFGEGGKNFVDTMLRLGAERDEVSVVFDQVGSPTWTGHLAPALVGLAERGGRGVYHGAGAGACSWFELAIEAMRLRELECRVVAVTTDEFPRPAPRPAFSVLATEREDGIRLPDWHEGVEAHVKEVVPA